MLKFFELGDRNTLHIAKEEVLLHPEFAAVYRKSKPVEGDSDGRKKVYAYSVFAFIYFMYDYGSSFSDLNDKERNIKSIKEANLPPEWTPNAMEKEAIEKYVQLQIDKTPTLKIVTNLKRGLTMSSDIIKLQIDRMETVMLNVGMMAETLDYTKTDEVTAYNLLVETLSKNLLAFLPMSESINKTLDSIVKLEEKVIVELGSGETAAGGKEIGNRANPK